PHGGGVVPDRRLDRPSRTARPSARPLRHVGFPSAARPLGARGRPVQAPPPLLPDRPRPHGLVAPAGADRRSPECVARRRRGHSGRRAAAGPAGGLAGPDARRLRVAGLAADARRGRRRTWRRLRRPQPQLQLLLSAAVAFLAPDGSHAGPGRAAPRGGPVPSRRRGDGVLVAGGTPGRRLAGGGPLGVALLVAAAAPLSAPLPGPGRGRRRRTRGRPAAGREGRKAGKFGGPDLGARRRWPAPRAGRRGALAPRPRGRGLSLVPDGLAVRAG